jgi:uncharacterized membrane protein YagU involved in acid resistance
VAALPLIALTVYRTGYFSGVRHQGPLLTALFVLFSLVFAVLYVVLGGAFRYWSLTYFLKLEKVRRAKRAAAAANEPLP